MHELGVEMKRSRVKRLAAVGSALVLVGVLWSPSIAIAAPGDSPVVLASSSASVFATADGSPLRVVTNSDSLGERTVTGLTATAEPATLVFQSIPRTALAPAQGSLSTQADPGVTTTNPGLVTTTEVAKPLSTNPAEWIQSSSYGFTRTTASFSWERSATPFEVYKDDVLIGTSKNGTFTATGLIPATKYSFEMRGTVKDSSGTAIPSRKLINITTYSAIPSAVSQRMMSPQTYQLYSTAFVHKTFIPDATVPAWMCNYADSSYSFKGDNRTYVTPTWLEPDEAPNYRTMMFANVNWDNPSPYTVVTTKGVGQSVTLHNGSVYQATYASMSNMLFTDVQAGGSYAQVRFDHTASNPHCKIWDVNYGGAIKYNELVMFYRGGMVDVEGWRSPVPAHEGYARFDDAAGNETWTTMFRKSNTGFQCLIYGTCANDSISSQVSR
jgi:hypothetical protein